jgi:hypothetical protein
MNRLKRQVENAGKWLLSCPRTLILIVVILIALAVGAEGGRRAERRRIDAEAIRVETDRQMDIKGLRIREAVCLGAFEDKAEYEFHKDRVVRAGLGLDGVYDYGARRGGG